MSKKLLISVSRADVSLAYLSQTKHVAAFSVSHTDVSLHDTTSVNI